MGAPPKTVETITGSGSNRQYVRFTSAAGKSVIGVIGTSLDENHAFCYLADHFSKQDLPVPRVLVVSSDGLRYLQEDLGARSLFDALSSGKAQPVRNMSGRLTLAPGSLITFRGEATVHPFTISLRVKGGDAGPLFNFKMTAGNRQGKVDVDAEGHVVYSRDAKAWSRL